MTLDNRDLIIEIREQNKIQSKHLDDMKAIVGDLTKNMRYMNDANVLHHTKILNNQTGMMEKLQLLTGKYWWLILALMGTTLIIMGYKDAINVWGIGA